MDSGYKVFIIDDSDIACEMASIILEDAGIQVDSSDSPFDLQSKLTVFAPDLILLDVRMPGVKESQLVDLVSEFRRACSARVLLYTAFSLVETTAFMKACGADGIIQKSPHDEEFVEGINKWLQA